MSLPIFVQARDSINKAYVALQNWNTNPADIPLPNVINTKRHYLSNKQIAARYLKSIEGNADIDINKIPKMKVLDRIDHELPITNVQKAIEKIKRKADCNRSEHSWPHPECQERYFDEYKAVKEDGSYWKGGICPVSYDLIGGGDPRCTCIRDLPQFVVCSEQYLEETLFDSLGWPQQILDYRNVSGLWSEHGSEGSCAREGRDMCPDPATTPDEINVQIEETIKKNTATVVYLMPVQLDDYLSWRKTNGTMDGFQYIRVADKKPAEPASPPANKNWILWTAVGAGALAAVGLGAGAIRSESKRMSRLRTIVATSSAPAHNAPTLSATSPSSMGSVSTTVPEVLITNKKSRASTTSIGTTTAAQPNSNSSADSTEDISLDIPPAGQEDGI